MKVLLVTDYATLTGGAEIVTLSLRDHLRSMGHDARIFASRAHAPGVERFADYECLGTLSRFRTLLQAANPWAAWRLHRVLDEFRPDVVHVRMFLTQLSPLILPALRRVPSVFDIVWYRPICPVGTKMLPTGAPCRERAGWACYRNRCLPLRDWVVLTAQMRLWRRWRTAFRTIVAVSDAMRRRLDTDGIEATGILHNGVPAAPPRPALTWPPTIAFAGRLVAEKGVDVLLRAFAAVLAKMPDARLLIAGDGPERARLERLAGELGVAPATTMLGFLPRAALERRLAGAWVHAIPSQWAEPFGMVAIEAMMRGTAVVATDTGGLAEIVRDGRTGRLVAPGDAAALAAALLEFLEDRQRAERAGRAGRDVALAEFSETAFTANCIALYETICREESHVRT